MSGPALGGVLSEYFGFPICTTVMAILSALTVSTCKFDQRNPPHT